LTANSKLVIVEFGVEAALLTKTTGHGDFTPQHMVWRSPASTS
jgi:hypothetical protein